MTDSIPSPARTAPRRPDLGALLRDLGDRVCCAGLVAAGIAGAALIHGLLGAWPAFH